MVRDPELKALLEQAARNLKTLEVLIAAVEPTPESLHKMQQQVERLRRAYVLETDALTRQVLRRAVDRRTGGDRRREPEPQPVGT